jgi:hypothetical protein
MSNIPVTKADIKAADDIFGKNLGSLKGKMVRQSASHISVGVDAIPPEVLRAGRNVSVTIDIMFVNKLPFFITLSLEIKFGTVESIPNQQVTTIRNFLEKVVRLYKNRGLTVSSILVDSEFELIQPWFPTLNTAAADEHVLDIKYPQRVHKRNMPYRHLPRIMLIHLVKNTVFWLNAFPIDDRVSKKYSPRYIMTSHQLSGEKHAVLLSSDLMYKRTKNIQTTTMGCICLGPTGCPLRLVNKNRYVVGLSSKCPGRQSTIFH